MFHYLKHAYTSTLFINLTIAAMFWAPQWVLVVTMLAVFYQVGMDLGTPHDLSMPDYRMPLILDALLFLWVPASARCMFALLWLAAPGDLWGVGGWIDSHVAGGVLAAKAEAGWFAILSAAVAIGILLSGNMVVGHELVHRTSDRLAMVVGRWLLGIVGQAQFSISHVYGHHPNVGTPLDCATARRGENVYWFALRSTIGEYITAWKLERRRLSGRPALLFRLTNRVTTGLGPTALMVALFYAGAGARGVAAYAVTVLVSTFMYQAVQYIEHYGLIRVAGTPVASRHSWSCTTRGSSHALINLTRHSHHHADARVKFWALTPMEGALELPYGYAGHALMSMVPPLWFGFAHPRLNRWEEELATPQERELARQDKRFMQVVGDAA